MHNFDHGFRAPSLVTAAEGWAGYLRKHCTNIRGEPTTRHTSVACGTLGPRKSLVFLDKPGCGYAPTVKLNKLFIALPFCDTELVNAKASQEKKRHCAAAVTFCFVRDAAVPKAKTQMVAEQANTTL